MRGTSVEPRDERMLEEYAVHTPNAPMLFDPRPASLLPRHSQTGYRSVLAKPIFSTSLCFRFIRIFNSNISGFLFTLLFSCPGPRFAKWTEENDGNFWILKSFGRLFKPQTLIRPTEHHWKILLINARYFSREVTSWKFDYFIYYFCYAACWALFMNLYANSTGGGSLRGKIWKKVVVSVWVTEESRDPENECMRDKTLESRWGTKRPLSIYIGFGTPVSSMSSALEKSRKCNYKTVGVRQQDALKLASLIRLINDRVYIR